MKQVHAIQKLEKKSQAEKLLLEENWCLCHNTLFFIAANYWVLKKVDWVILQSWQNRRVI